MLKNRIFVMPAFLWVTKNDSVLSTKNETSTRRTSKKKTFLYRRKNKSEITAAAKDAKQEVNKIAMFIFRTPCDQQQREL